MKRYELDGLTEKYRIVEPIVIEEQRFSDDNHVYVSLVVVGLENEQVFGLARRFPRAKQMLINTIIDYYECLKKSEGDCPDKEFLMRCINESDS